MRYSGAWRRALHLSAPAGPDPSASTYFSSFHKNA